MRYQNIIHERENLIYVVLTEEERQALKKSNVPYTPYKAGINERQIQDLLDKQILKGTRIGFACSISSYDVSNFSSLNRSDRYEYIEYTFDWAKRFAKRTNIELVATPNYPGREGLITIMLGEITSNKNAKHLLQSAF